MPTSGNESTGKVALLVLSELRGEVLPCSCVGRPVGGVDRLRQGVATYRAQHPDRESVLLAIGSHHAVGNAIYAQRADYIRGLYERLEVGLWTIGHADAMYGLAGVEAWSRGLPHALGGNVEGDVALPDVQMIEVTDTDGETAYLAVVQALHPDFRNVVVQPFERMTLTDPRAYLQDVLNRPAVETARGRVAILHGTRAQLREMLPAARKADLIIGVEGGRIGTSEIRGREVFYAGAEGRHLGVIELSLGKDEVFIEGTKLVPFLESSRRFPEEQLLLNRHLAEQDALRAKLGSDTNPHLARHEYAGNESCQSCHADIYAQWQRGPHAKALSDLPAARLSEVKSVIIDALPKGQAGVFGSERPGQRDSPIAGCETCHGPAKEHAETGARVAFAAARKSCQACHALASDALMEYRLGHDAGEQSEHPWWHWAPELLYRWPFTEAEQ